MDRLNIRLLATHFVFAVLSIASFLTLLWSIHHLSRDGWMQDSRWGHITPQPPSNGILMLYVCAMVSTVLVVTQNNLVPIHICRCGPVLFALAPGQGDGGPGVAAGLRLGGGAERGQGFG